MEIIRRVQRHKGSLTARPTSRAETKVGLNDPTAPSGRGPWLNGQKLPRGITGWWRPRVHIDGAARHLDVGSSHPGGEVTPKGWAVRPLKRYASWVSDRRETGRSLSAVGVGDLRGAAPSTRGTGVDRPLVCQLSRQGHSWVANVGQR